MSDLVVVGAVNVDLVVTAERLPAPGETVVGPGLERHGGGKGANAAVAAARVGAPVRFVGAVGDDDLGRAALDELRAEGVGVEGVAVLDGVATGAALIVVDAAGENQIAVGAGANGCVDPDAVRAAIGDAGLILVSTEIPFAAVRAAVTSGAPCVLNPAPVLPELAELLVAGPILTPNAGELAALGRSIGHEGPHIAAALRGRSGAPVVVTLGGDGVLVVDVEQHAVAAKAVTVRDTTGAGDTFNGVLAARLLAGDDLRAAAGTATRAAGLSVGAVGARGGMPHAADL